MRNFCLIILLQVFFFTFHANADPWECGTPLLSERYTHIQNNGIVNAENVSGAPALPINFGQIENFFIHIPESSIKATCVAVGIHCYIYVDNTVLDMISANQAKDVANTFDTVIYPKVHDWIGSEFKPGLDRDNRITILFHDVGLNESGADYGGYFSSIDLHPTYPTSNRRDILYMDIYQFKERSRHTFYSSLSHEFAHLVNWYQNGGTSDQRWLEEGLASFTEWGVYGTVHNIFVDQYFADPTVSLTTANTADIYYGAAFMFLLYLYENHGGKSVIRQLASEDKLGLEAISKTIGKKHPVDFFLKWAFVNWINSPAFGLQNSYRNLPNRKISSHISQVTTYPNEIENRSIESWGIQYILFKNLPNTLEITLKQNSQANLYANLVYLFPNNKIPITLPIPSIPNPNLDESSSYIKIGQLNNEAQILLIVTSEYPQAFNCLAHPSTEDSDINIGEIENYPIRNFENLNVTLAPITVSYPPKNSTEPIHRSYGIINGIINPNSSVFIEPISQIHLSSNFREIIIHENTAFAASEWGMEVFTLNENLKKVSEIATPGTAQGIAIDGTTVFVADGNSGIQLFDVSQQQTPRLIKSIKGFQDARGVHLANGNLYALDAIRGLLIYRLQDIYNLQNPQPKRIYKTRGTPLSVSTKGEMIFLSDTAVGVYILTPDPFGGFIVNSTVPLAAVDFEIGAEYIQLVSANLHILNVENPLVPTTISRINTPGITSGIQRHQNLIYMTDKHTGFQIVNVSNPFNPQVISSVPTIGNPENIALWNPQSTDGLFVLIADGKAGIQTFDVSNPYMPKWVNHYNEEGTAFGLGISDNETMISVALGKGGIKIIELTNPYSGNLVREIRTIPGDMGALSTNIENEYCYIGHTDGMMIVDIISGETIAKIDTNEPVWAIALIDNYAYLCTKSLVVVDVTVPQLSRIIARRELSGSAYKIALNSSHAFVAALEGGVHILDISEPTFPRHVAEYTTQGTATNITLTDTHAYVLDTNLGVLKLDISDPTEPTLQSQYVDTTLPIAAKTNGEFLYLLDIESLHGINTKTMQRHALYTQFQSPTDLIVSDNAIYVTDQNQLTLFNINSRNNNLGVEDPFLDDEQVPINSSTIITNQLLQNYPNPFNPDTWIPYSLTEGTEVTLSIYNEYGQLIVNIQFGHKLPGNHVAHWNGRNANREKMASGVYFYRISTDKFTATRKMVLQR